LNEVTLPCTTLHAIKVCRNLDMRYLWADRLCIVQDADWATKSVQLNQMADIYSQVRLTILALAGEDVECRLPGVSNARPVVQKQLAYSPQFGLVESTRDIEQCLQDSTGQQRGWT
jgi:lipase chaperone LimK